MATKTKDKAKLPARRDTVIPPASQQNAPAGFKIVGQVTVPTLKQADDTQYIVKVLAAIRAGENIASREGKERKGADGNKMGPPDLMRVQLYGADGTPGGEYDMIANAVMANELKKVYPNDGYVGKIFAIMRQKVEGKRWRAYHIVEIEPTK